METGDVESNGGRKTTQDEVVGEDYVRITTPCRRVVLAS